MNHMSDPRESITLLTVNYYSWNYIRFLSFTAEKLAERGWKEWLMMDNSPDEAQANLLRKLPTVRVLPAELARPCIAKAPYYKNGLYKNDYSCAVNELYKRVTTEYTLLIDPDVALLQKGWDSILMEEMESNGYDAIGGPYHPRKWRQYAGYPCVIFLFIRTRLLQESNFDFCAYSNNPVSSRWEVFLHKRQSLINRFYPPLIRGSSQDAGWRLPQLFRNYHSKTETFDVPFISDVDNHFPGPLARVKPKETFSRPSRGLFEEDDIYDTEYEEFWHRGNLFATHRGRSSPRDAELGQYLSAGGRWAPGQPQFWFSKVMEYTGLDIEELDSYMQEEPATREAGGDGP